MGRVQNYEATYLALGVCMSANVPVILWGPPGQGKTSVIRDLASAQDRPLEVILASIREPQDFAGLPVVKDGTMRLVPPDWANRLAEHGNGILFLDEVNTAPPSVQAALLRVSLDKVAGDCYLGDETAVVAAANPPEIAADGWDLAPPLANRFCHLDWDLPLGVVRAGFAGAWPRYSMPHIDPSEAARLGDAERLVVGAFLSARSELLTAMPSNSAEQGRAFPTPRSWDMMATALGWCAAAGVPATVASIVAKGCVGPGAAAEYLAFKDNLDIPDPEAALSDPQNVDLPARADKLYVLIGGVIKALADDQTANRWLSTGVLLERMVGQGNDDLAVSFARQWLQLKLPDADMPASVFKSLLPLMQAARLL